jgi:hypothetical protein
MRVASCDCTSHSWHSLSSIPHCKSARDIMRLVGRKADLPHEVVTEEFKIRKMFWKSADIYSTLNSQSDTAKWIPAELVRTKDVKSTWRIYEQEIDYPHYWLTALRKRYDVDGRIEQFCMSHYLKAFEEVLPSSRIYESNSAS